MAGAALAPSHAARSGVLRSALTLIGLGTAALALCRAGVLGLGILFLIGLCSAVVNVSVITALQESTPPALRGRALAVTIAVAGAATPFGLALGGLMGSVAESALPWVMAVCGAGILACAPFAPDRRRASDPT
jgi:MFS family permease